MRTDSSGPMPAIGSSSSSMRGRVASAMAISSWRCSPWLMLETSTSSRPARPTRASTSRAGSRNAASLRASRQKLERMAGVRLHRERHVVERGEIVEQRGDLERAREPELAAPVDRQRGDVVAGEADAAGVRRDLAGELADQRGLAGAVRADDGVQLARRHRERDAVGGDHAAEALGQSVDLQQCVSHGADAPASR